MFRSEHFNCPVSLTTSKEAGEEVGETSGLSSFSLLSFPIVPQTAAAPGLPGRGLRVFKRLISSFFLFSEFYSLGGE